MTAPAAIVLTGGPGAGKTAVIEMLRRSLSAHVHVVQEAAGVVFGGGFPRAPEVPARQAAQRAIYYVQRELEAVASSATARILLCDRGTVDGAAYWPEPGTLWAAVGTTAAAELDRYHAVIHLRTPADGLGYNHANPLRVESAAEAAAIDERIARVWAAHPRRFEVPAGVDFVGKAAHAIALLQAELAVLGA